MQVKYPRFRRGALSIGQVKCEGCEKVIQHGEVYLSVDEKPNNKPRDESVFKEETVYIDEIHCSECEHELRHDEIYLFVLDGDIDKVFCAACYKKKGGDTYKKKNLGAERLFNKTKEPTTPFRFCTGCCEKRKAGAEKKEKGEKSFTFFPSKTGREAK